MTSSLPTVSMSAFLLQGVGGSSCVCQAPMTSGEGREKQSACQLALLVLFSVPTILFPFIDAGGMGAQVFTGLC